MTVGSTPSAIPNPPSDTRVVFMGTSGFAVPALTKLFELGYTITGVVTQPDKPSGRGQSMHFSPVKKKALDLNLATYQPSRLKDQETVALFRALAPDMILVVAYGKILPPWMLDLARYRCVNLHGSLLPKYRGAAPIQWAIANGESETGVCTMQIDEGLDTGPLFLSQKVSIGSDETSLQLSERLALIGSELLVRTVRGIVEGELAPEPQDASRATMAPIIKKQDGHIDWRNSASAIHNQVRAFNPWPATVTRFRGTACKILKTRFGVKADTLADPGVLIVEKGKLTVCCGDASLLEVVQLQLENRKPVPGADFVHGARIQPGEKFQFVSDN